MAATYDSIRLYDNGQWGEMGYAVPYFPPDKTHTNNQGVKYLADALGKNLFGLMHDPDVQSTVPPKLPFLVKIHKLVVRLRSILDAEVIQNNEFDKRAMHVTPNPEPFLLYPTPFFRVRNSWSRKWAGFMMMAISEAMQHQDNIHSLSVHKDFADIVRMYPDMVYFQLAVEFFGKSKEQANDPKFLLTDTDFKTYDPDKWFTLTERVDRRAPLIWSVSEEDLGVLADGIPAPAVKPFMRPWPLNYMDVDTGVPANKVMEQTQAAANAESALASKV